MKNKEAYAGELIKKAAIEDSPMECIIAELRNHELNECIAVNGCRGCIAKSISWLEKEAE